ncbi:MAG: hypothetical protein M1469_11755 [Bacteroidetes bacterium]|nr:hypothetical protein [Bacteroidota bacterium]
MEPKEQTRAPAFNGINVSGEALEADYADNLVNVVTFFEPVTKNSLDTVEIMRLMSRRYESLSVGFWYVMEPRLSCMYHAKESQMTLDRLSLFGNTLFDANNTLILQFRVNELPAVLIIDSNGMIKSRYEGEVSLRSFERSIQARLAVSGYRDELPNMGELGFNLVHSRGSSKLRQLGYVTGDYVFTSLVVPETNQEFSLPDFCLVNTIYPHGPWYVGRDFIEGSGGSTVYISCSRDQAVLAFTGSCDGASVRMHTAIEAPQSLVLGKDVKREGSVLELRIDEHRPYELLASSGDSDVLISLQVQSGSIRLYSVEFCDLERVAGPTAANWVR